LVDLFKKAKDEEGRNMYGEIPQHVVWSTSAISIFIHKTFINYTERPEQTRAKKFFKLVL